jgi:hypothetical protein
MKKALVFAAISEAATGAGLVIVPSLIGQSLLGAEFAGVAVVVARVLGIALIALGVACWPGPPRVGMLIYSGAVALYLAYAGLALGFAGILLWPAVVLHAVLTLLLARACLEHKRKEQHNKCRLSCRFTAIFVHSPKVL